MYILYIGYPSIKNKISQRLSPLSLLHSQQTLKNPSTKSTPNVSFHSHTDTSPFDSLSALTYKNNSLFTLTSLSLIFPLPQTKEQSLKFLSTLSSHNPLPLSPHTRRSSSPPPFKTSFAPLNPLPNSPPLTETLTEISFIHRRIRGNHHHETLLPSSSVKIAAQHNPPNPHTTVEPSGHQPSRKTFVIINATLQRQSFDH